MPQMRAVMSGASVKARPRRNASKKRGGSKMRSSALLTTPSRITTVSAPSPSTRAGASTLMVLRAMAVALLAEFRIVGIEGAPGAVKVALAHAEPLEPGAQRLGVGGLLRAEAAVAAAVEGRGRLLRDSVGLCPQHGDRLRAHGREHRRLRGQPAHGAGRRARFRRLAQGGAL